MTLGFYVNQNQPIWKYKVQHLSWTCISEILVELFASVHFIELQTETEKLALETGTDNRGEMNNDGDYTVRIMKIQMKLLGLVVRCDKSQRPLCSSSQQCKKYENFNLFYRYAHILNTNFPTAVPKDDSGKLRSFKNLSVEYAWVGMRLSSEAWMWCELLWQFRESLQTRQPFLEDSFSCQLSRPTGSRIRVAPFHTAGVENADSHHYRSHQIWWADPQRPHWPN